MEFHTLLLYAFISLETVVGTFAYSSPSEVYWQSTLPTTPMPKAILKLLHPTGEDAYVGVGKDFLSLIDDKDSYHRHEFYYAGSGDGDLHSGARSFFLETELHEGAIMKLQFPKIINKAKFLPHQVAQSIPFSTTQLPHILTHFSVDANSLEAANMKRTLRLCEAPAVRGEDKYCAQSLESLVDFWVSKLGKEGDVFATDVEKEAPQVYTIGNDLRRIGDKSVVCHKLNYVYAVFYCHEIRFTKAYRVELKELGGGGDNKNGNGNVAVAVCHTDTSSWNPKHAAFQLLKVKPGTVPICHFLPSGTLMFVSK